MTVKEFEAMWKSLSIPDDEEMIYIGIVDDKTNTLMPAVYGVDRIAQIAAESGVYRDILIKKLS